MLISTFAESAFKILPNMPCKPIEMEKKCIHKQIINYEKDKLRDKNVMLLQNHFLLDMWGQGIA